MENSTTQRPTFLTVLCILTFIGSGLGLLGSLLALVGSAFLASIPMLGAAGAASGLMAGLGIASSGLCLFGAIQMWNLKKSGFMLYVFGIILSLVSSLMTTLAVSDMANRLGARGVSVGWGSFAFALILSAAWVFMYNVNRKHLVN